MNRHQIDAQARRLRDHLREPNHRDVRSWLLEEIIDDESRANVIRALNRINSQAIQEREAHYREARRTLRYA